MRACAYAHTHTHNTHTHTCTHTHTHTHRKVPQKIKMSQSIPYIWNNLQWNIQIIFWLLKLLSTQVMACNKWVLHSAFYSLSTHFPQAMEWQPSTCHTYVCAADNGWHFWHFDFVIINSSVQITSIRGQPLSQPYQQQHRKWPTPNVHGKLKIYSPAHCTKLAVQVM